jgi:flagellar hook-associated protein 3 FlgL
MTTRVSTAGNYQSALLNLMTAQNRSIEAQERISTEKIATDLAGYGRGSETLAALKGSQARIQGFIDTGETVAARLTTQDLALNQVADGAGDARQAIADALAAGSLDGLMLELQGHFQSVQNGLNAQHQGRYLFSGGNVSTPPVAVGTMATLTDALTATPPDPVFTNGALKQSSRIDEGATVQTGFLASDLGADLFNIFKDIQVFNDDTTEIKGPITDDVRDFLTAQLSRLDAARTHVTDAAAQNGALQNRVESTLTSQEAQKTSLDELVGKRTDVDMAKAVTDLQLAQIAIQASAQVINQLSQTSLLNVLR